MSAVYRWTGYLQRDLETGGLVGELVDPFGFTIQLVATRGTGCYAITGIPGPAPEAYAIPLIDDETATG
jgi:hypothetical protein